MYLWLLSAIAAAYISERKGYSDRAGLATGLCLSIVGPIVWLADPGQVGLEVEDRRAVGRQRTPHRPDAPTG